MFKKLLLSIFFFMVCSVAHAATTWYACTSGGNWSANVWTSVMADQGTCAAALGTPVAGDTATLNSSSGNITITGAAAAATLDETGYTGTLAFGTQTLTLTAGANLGSAMTSTSGTISDGGGTITLLSTVTGSFPTLKITASTTLTASTFTWPGALTIAMSSGSQTLTLSNSGATWTNTGLVTTSTNTFTLNLTTTGDTLTCNGGLTISSTIDGNAVVILGGGTWSGGNNFASSGGLILAGNITVSGTVNIANTTVTYSSGTITTTGSTLNFNAGSSLNTSGMTWNIILVGAGGGPTITLLSNINAVTFNNSNGGITFSGSFNINVQNWIEDSSDNFVAGQTLNVTNSIEIGTSVNNSLTIKSATSSSPTYINYTGTKSNQFIEGNIFTDVQATGNKLYNYNGAALTRTANIVNVNGSNLNPKSVNYYQGV